jgi:hypothetical protein
MSLKQQAFILLAALMVVHIGVLTYASVECVSGRITHVRCKTMGTSWQRTAESYVAVILALLVPTTLDQ